MTTGAFGLARFPPCSTSTGTLFSNSLACTCSMSSLRWTMTRTLALAVLSVVCSPALMYARMILLSVA